MSRGKEIFAVLGQSSLAPRHRKTRPSIYGWGPYFCPSDYAQPRIKSGNFGRSVIISPWSWGHRFHVVKRINSFAFLCPNTAKISSPPDMVILGDELFGEIHRMPVCLENTGFVALYKILKSPKTLFPNP